MFRSIAGMGREEREGDNVKMQWDDFKHAPAKKFAKELTATNH